MFRLFYVIFMNLFRAPFMIPKMRYEADHPKKYSITQRYELAQRCIRLMNHSGRITTEAYGSNLLPQTGGYVMFPNHQGKYDALGIILTHEMPCSLVMDKDKSCGILVREFVDLLEGKRLRINDPRQGVFVINEMTKEVKKGKKYIIFPEGGYQDNNKNVVYEFKAGSFKAAVNAKAPIVPVALYDSYKVFNAGAGMKPVKTQVHYLKPIVYEEYCEMNTRQIAAMVQEQIANKLHELQQEETR